MIFRAYYPKPLFPPISLSDGCMLMCRHCMGRYLEGMEKVKKDNLLDFCKTLEREGKKGILVSGGSDTDGRIIGLEESINTLKRVKEETGLLIAVHTGYVGQEEANQLVDACDIAFVDIVGDDETVREVIGLESSEMYTETMKNLISAGIRTTPHITIGLNYGKIKGEENAIEMAKSFHPEKIVLNIILPTKHTDFENINLPSAGEIERMIRKSREGGQAVSLGCMRPRRMREIEKIFIDNGVREIALPSKETLIYAEGMGFEIEKIPGCCGLTEDLVRRIVDG